MTDSAAAPTFRHGVTSADPRPRRVVISTRLSGVRGQDPVSVRWRVFEEVGGRPAGHGRSLARPDADWTVRVDVGGLQPDTAYTYDFEIGGERSPTGQMRTLPERDPE